MDGRCTATDAGEPDSGEPDANVADAGPSLLPLGTCNVTPSPEPFVAPRLEYHWKADGLPFPSYTHAVSAPVVVNFIPEPLDHDMIPEIIFPTYASSGGTAVLRVVSGRAPHDTLMTLPGDGSGPAAVGSTATPSLVFDASAAAGDLDGDGLPEIVTMSTHALIAYKNDGSILWSTTLPVDELGSLDTEMAAAVAIHDLDGDGRPEVVAGRVALDGQDGHVLWTGTGGMGSNGPYGRISCVADIIPSSPGRRSSRGTPCTRPRARSSGAPIPRPMASAPSRT